MVLFWWVLRDKLSFQCKLASYPSSSDQTTKGQRLTSNLYKTLFGGQFISQILQVKPNCCRFQQVSDSVIQQTFKFITKNPRNFDFFYQGELRKQFCIDQEFDTTFIRFKASLPILYALKKNSYCQLITKILPERSSLIPLGQISYYHCVLNFLLTTRMDELN